jgi:hypothetical protein
LKQRERRRVVCWLLGLGWCGSGKAGRGPGWAKKPEQAEKQRRKGKRERERFSFSEKDFK